MRIALVYDEGQNLKPLDEGEILAIIDEEQEVVEQYENPGFKIGKDVTMDAIIQLGAQAIIVKHGYLDQKSYDLSKGHLAYMLIDQYNTLTEIIENLDDVKSLAVEELNGL
ncbi:MAG: hypothetical protein C0171_03220 [Caldisphaera sp.]|jgi:hypothetical protein|uniref:hypothetical protein n=1 Tax=Caldisphaera sp. TaxID=2060322 RepID=UPI000CB4A147|nr:hypothetical protein [Caldisphaera sp.]PMP59550.1 MAG: hypothetical protein C0201_04650 [Caldisphaera sp.]PMP91199.1 MAG: hypothetical protein C0171_03220 [Caldisphaera sp.]